MGERLGRRVLEQSAQKPHMVLMPMGNENHFEVGHFDAMLAQLRDEPRVGVLGQRSRVHQR